jgi:hypothetical protein
MRLIPAILVAAIFSVPPPELFAPGVISDANEQWRITFTPDGKTAYFAESPQFFPVTRQATIYVSRLRDGAWTEPVVAPFSGTHSDIDPFITPGGDRMYFSSIRPVDGVARGDIDLWMMRRDGDGWGAPEHLGPEVNSPDNDELYPSEARDGTLYFASGPAAPAPGKHWDIFSAQRTRTGFTSRAAMGDAINTAPAAGDASPVAAWEFNPEISADGRTLVFTSLRPGGHGLGDLYVSTREAAGGWRKARNLGTAVNTAADEYHPTLAGHHLYFVRRGPPPVRGDFYRVALAELGLSGP